MNAIGRDLDFPQGNGETPDAFKWKVTKLYLHFRKLVLIVLVDRWAQAKMGT